MGALPLVGSVALPAAQILPGRRTFPQEILAESVFEAHGQRLGSDGNGPREMDE
jgi:hypothetical protein